MNRVPFLVPERKDSFPTTAETVPANNLSDALAEAEDRALDWLALHRWHRDLESRLRVAQLQFDYVGYDFDSDMATGLADEIHAFRDLCAALRDAADEGGRA